MKEIFLCSREKGKIRIALCYPNSSKVGLSSLAFHKILKLFSNSDFYINRFFFENNQTINFDNFFSLNEANIILFTISFELDSINAISMLIQNNIEIKKEKRKILIVAGGIFPTINNNFFSTAFDFVFNGEIESVENKFIDILKSFIDKTKTVDLLNKEIGKKQYITQDFKDPSHSIVLTDNTTFQNTFLIEISRGCLYKCSYCLLSKYYKDFRIVPEEILIEKINFGLKYSKKIGLISALSNLHPSILSISEYILRKDAEVLFSSLRIELLNNDFFEILSKSNQKILTLGIESANENIRKKIGKSFSNDLIISTISKALKYNIRIFKLYFIAGLPGDENGEIYIIELVKKIREVFLLYAKEKGVMPLLILNISLFVPKINNYFEDKEFKDEIFYNHFIKKLKKELCPLGIEIRNDNYFFSASQYILQKADSMFFEEIYASILNKKSIKKLIFNKLKEIIF